MYSVVYGYTCEFGEGSPAAMAMLLDVLYEDVVFLRRPRTFLEPALVAARRPSHDRWFLDRLWSDDSSSWSSCYILRLLVQRDGCGGCLLALQRWLLLCVSIYTVFHALTRTHTLICIEKYHLRNISCDICHKIMSVEHIGRSVKNIWQILNIVLMY